eukprot:15475798-Alexandrium_andersonii.AAC.2
MLTGKVGLASSSGGADQTPWTRNLFRGSLFASAMVDFSYIRMLRSLAWWWQFFSCLWLQSIQNRSDFSPRQLLLLWRTLVQRNCRIRCTHPLRWHGKVKAALQLIALQARVHVSGEAFTALRNEVEPADLHAESCIYLGVPGAVGMGFAKKQAT